MEWDGVEWNGIGWDGMWWDGVGWDRMGSDRMGWNGVGRDRVTPECPTLTSAEDTDKEALLSQQAGKAPFQIKKP